MKVLQTDVAKHFLHFIQKTVLTQSFLIEIVPSVKEFQLLYF